MANPRFKWLYDNFGLSGTWTADSQTGTLPAIHLANANRGRVYRSASDTSEWVKVDLGSTQAVGAIALVDANFTSSAAVTIEANTSDAFTSPAFSTTLTVYDDLQSGVMVHFLSSSRSYRWWRVKVNDPANPDGYIQIGAVVLGPVFDLADAVRSDPVYRLVDGTQVVWAPGGTPHGYDLPFHVELDLSLGLQSKTALFSDIHTALRSGGVRRDGILTLFGNDVDEHNSAKLTTLYGRMTDLGDWTGYPVELFQNKFTFRESR